MGARFTRDERDRIRLALVEAARERFARDGLKQTSLDDLTRSAGIAKATFYLFFPSKEALYLDLLALEAPGVDARVTAHLRDDGAPASTALRAFLSALLREYATNPLLGRLVAHPEELEAVAAKVRPEDLEAKAAWAIRPLLSFIEARQASGELRSADPHAVLGVLQAVPLLTLHRARFGPTFDATMDLVVTLVSEGLSSTNGSPQRPQDQPKGDA